MKKSILAMLMATATFVSAADSFWNRFSIAPVGVLRTADITGSSEWGAGVDVGYKINDFVNLSVVNLSYEGECKEWGGLLVDETDLLVKAKLTKFVGNETFAPYVLASGQRDWNTEDWGFGVGLGLEYNVTKHVSLGADYTLRAWFNHDKDSLARGFVRLSF